MGARREEETRLDEEAGPAREDAEREYEECVYDMCAPSSCTLHGIASGKGAFLHPRIWWQTHPRPIAPRSGCGCTQGVLGLRSSNLHTWACTQRHELRRETCVVQ